MVERRQQIGMLRAIGFQRSTISMAFLLESSFIAVMGILSGVVGGAIIGRKPDHLWEPRWWDGQRTIHAAVERDHRDGSGRLRFLAPDDRVA
ncbi:MAG: FtsX-like permease family protein [Tepidiformaceae bacterium]